MFAKLFALFFGKKEEPTPVPTIAQWMEQRRRTRDLYDNAAPMRTGKAGSARVPTTSTRREDDIMSNPIHPLNPLSTVYYDSTPSESSRFSSSYDCGSSSSSSSSYDSGSSSSCDSGSSPSSYGD